MRKVSSHPIEQSWIVASFQGNNEVSMWDLETSARQQTLWASPHPPLSQSHVSGFFQSLLPDIPCFINFCRVIFLMTKKAIEIEVALTSVGQTFLEQNVPVTYSGVTLVPESGSQVCSSS